MIYVIMLCVTGALSPLAFVTAGLPWLDAIRFTLISHILAALMLFVMGLANLL